MANVLDSFDTKRLKKNNASVDKAYKILRLKGFDVKKVSKVKNPFSKRDIANIDKAREQLKDTRSGGR